MLKNEVFWGKSARRLLFFKKEASGFDKPRITVLASSPNSVIYEK